MTTPDIAALTTERDARQTAKIERLQAEVAALLAENAELKRCNANQRAALKQPRDLEIEEEILGRAWAALTERATNAEQCFGYQTEKIKSLQAEIVRLNDKLAKIREYCYIAGVRLPW